MTQHFYRLILRSDFEGSPRHDEWLVGTLPELSAILDAELTSARGAYHAIFLGQHMWIECWESGSLVLRRGLGPAIVMRVQGIDDPFTFDEAGVPFGPELDDDTADFLGQEVSTGRAKTRAKVDWKVLDLPTMQGEPLRSGDPVTMTFANTPPVSSSYGHRQVVAG